MFVGYIDPLFSLSNFQVISNEKEKKNYNSNTSRMYMTVSVKIKLPTS